MSVQTDWVQTKILDQSLLLTWDCPKFIHQLGVNQIWPRQLGGVSALPLIIQLEMFLHIFCLNDNLIWQNSLNLSRTSKMIFAQAGKVHLPVMEMGCLLSFTQTSLQFHLHLFAPSSLPTSLHCTKRWKNPFRGRPGVTQGVHISCCNLHTFW